MELKIEKYIPADFGEKALKIGIIILAGYLLIQLIAWVTMKVFLRRQNRQSQMVIKKLISYTGVLLVMFLVFRALGIKLGALFGAAGVLGIVLGIASQTSIGNIISGIFLVSERSFEIGDLVKVGDKTGVVYSIDLLSIKLKTLDNLLIRIPNQTIISTELINITRFPIRRMDINISVSYKEDLKSVQTVLKEIATSNSLCLSEPEPLILLQNFGDNGIEILLGLWFEKDKYRRLRNGIFEQIKERFDKEGIEIPYPQLSLNSVHTLKELVQDKKN